MAMSKKAENATKDLKRFVTALVKSKGEVPFIGKEGCYRCYEISDAYMVYRVSGHNWCYQEDICVWIPKKKAVVFINDDTNNGLIFEEPVTENVEGEKITIYSFTAAKTLLLQALKSRLATMDIQPANFIPSSSALLVLDVALDHYNEASFEPPVDEIESFLRKAALSSNVSLQEFIEDCNLERRMAYAKAIRMAAEKLSEHPACRLYKVLSAKPTETTIQMTTCVDGKEKTETVSAFEISMDCVSFLINGPVYVTANPLQAQYACEGNVIWEPVQWDDGVLSLKPFRKWDGCGIVDENGQIPEAMGHAVQNDLLFFKFCNEMYKTLLQKQGTK